MPYSELEEFAKSNISEYMWIRSPETNEIIACFEFETSTLWFIKGKVDGDQDIDFVETEEWKVRPMKENGKIPC